MAITRTYQWLRGATTDIAGASAITTSPSYTTVTADVGNYLFVKETATNAKGSATTSYPPFGPITSAGTTYVPMAGRIEPIEAPVFGTPIVPRVIRREEQRNYDGDLAAHETIHQIAHNAASQTTAVASGNWSNAATWSNGVPVAGMTVHIPAAFTVTYDVNSAAALDIVMVHGKLIWSRAADTRLVCDTIHSAPGSEIDIGHPASPIPFSTTLGQARARIEFIGKAPGLSANNPGVTASGSNQTLGMMAMGKVTICGEEIQEKVDIVSITGTGATTITAQAGQDISKWRQGDWIYVLGREWSGFGPDTEYAGPTEYYLTPGDANVQHESNDSNGFKKDQSELRQITGINTTTRVITLDSPLTFAHPARTTTRTLPVTPHTLSAQYGFTQGQTVTIPARAMNMSRSVEFRSSGNLRKANGKINLQTRAHIMFMATDNVDARWFGCIDMARTAIDPSMVFAEPPPFQHPASTSKRNIWHRMYSDPAATIDLADPNNVRGRYAIHFHGPGPLGEGARFSRNMMKLIGAACWPSRGAPPQPGWVITHHNVNLAIERCNVADFTGAGIASETGQEIGQWIDNTVCRGRSDGWGPSWFGRQRMAPNHNGHGGIAYENQARQILQRNNEAVGCRVGWLYEAQGVGDYGYVRGPDPASLRLFNPLIGGSNMYDDRDSYGVAQAQVTDLHGCVGVDLDVMFRADHRVDIMRQDNTPFIALGWRCYAVNRIMNVENYSYNYFFRDLAYFGPQAGASVSFMGTRSAQFGWKNGIIEGFSRFAADGRINHGPGWIDIATDMTQAPEDGSGAIKTSASMPTIAPSFTMKNPPDSDMSLTLYGDNPDWGGQAAVLFRGTMVDGFSPSGRPWPFWQEDSASAPDNGGFNSMMSWGGATSYWLIERNGVYQKAGGQWVMPGWFGTVDWKTFDAFSFKVEFPLAGTWETGFLEANTIPSDRTPPAWPLAPEDYKKPFATQSAPTNIVAPSIGGLNYVGGSIECYPGEWSSRPNYPHWFSYQWFRGATPISNLRVYVPQAADAGQQITCKVTAINTAGSSAAIVSSNTLVPRPAYTGPTPQTIFGAALKDWWEMDDPDTPFDAYNPGTAYSPGVMMMSQRRMYGWAGNQTLRTFGTVGSLFTVLQTGWGADNGRLSTTRRVKGKQKGRLWTGLGSGNNPMHLWCVVQRPNVNQTQFNGPVIMAAGHATWVSDADAAQNVIGNSTSGQTLATFPKGGRGAIYHGRDSNGSAWGFNNTRFTTANGGISNGDREVNLGYNGSMIDYKALYWVEANGITAQQHADMQAYLAWKYNL